MEREWRWWCRANVVESDGLAPGRWQGSQEPGDGAGDGSSGFAGGTDGQEEARMALMEDQDGLAVGAEEHEVCLPMAGGAPVLGLRRAFCQRTPEGDERSGAAASAPPPASFGLGPG